MIVYRQKNGIFFQGITQIFEDYLIKNFELFKNNSNNPFLVFFLGRKHSTLRNHKIAKHKLLHIYFHSIFSEKSYIFK